MRWTENPVEAIELAASNCYDSDGAGTGRIFEHCWKSGHQSVAEFAQFHFHIEGVSRALLAQLTRHRTASYAVRSQRYCSEDGCKYVIPRSIQDTPEAMMLYSNALGVIDKCYEALCGIGIPCEDARFILPNACETELDMSIDFRNLCHFMNERLCAKAQWEIRQLAQAMRDCVVKVFPEAKGKMVPKCMTHPIRYCMEAKPCKGVLSGEDLKAITDNCEVRE